MPIPTSQSDIAEVRDQLSLDYADGEYLNTVAANLGLRRPPFGFSDAVWRAVVRICALQYKQIAHKYEELLSVVLGPKITQCGALAENVLAGATYARLVDSSQFPQCGEMVLDEGSAGQETVRYSFIDRYTNTVYFESPLLFNHNAVNQVWETGVISDVAVSSGYVNVFDVSGFPLPGGGGYGNYTICIGRGTPYEAAGPIQSLVTDARKVGIPFSVAGGTGVSFASGTQLVQDGGPSQQQAYYLTLLDVSAMPLTNGWLQSGALSSALTATAGTTTSVTVAGPLTTSRYGGFWIRFNGNVTAALANKVAYVEDNNTTTFTFGNTLVASPAAGDTFVLLNNFQYIRANSEDNSVLLKRELPDLRQYPAACEFSIVQPTMTVAIAQVQVKGVGWDVFQSDPRHVEILLPENFLVNTIRTASYIREVGGTGSDTAAANRIAGDTDIEINSTVGFPLIGVLDHVVESERYTYYIPHAWVTEDAAIGATSIQVTDTSQFLPTGTLRYNASTVLYTVVDSTTLSTAPLPAAVRVTALVHDELRFRLATPLLDPVTIGDTIDFWASYDLGSVWTEDDTWAGPYVWNYFAETHKKQTLFPSNSLTEVVSGPTQLAVDRLLNATVFELVDASSFPTAVPYNVLLGENSGNVETLAVQQLSLRSRTYETVAGVAVSPGDTTVQLASLAGPVAPANAFPNGGPYRVVLSPFSADQEVVEVLSTNGVNTLNLSQPAVNAHPIGRRAVLLADLIRVSPAAADDHVGNIRYTDRFGLYAPETQNAGADMVRPLYTQATLNLSGVEFSATADNAIINHGTRRTQVSSRLSASVIAGATVLTLTDTSDFPTTGYPYAVYVDVGAGPLKQEVLHVTNNNVGLNQLTVSHGTVFAHDANRLVEFRPGKEETVSYTSRVGSVLNFSPYLVINSTHYENEFIAPSVGTGYPRNTGLDFPLRMPVTVEERVRYVIDLVRAAGVEVTFVSKR